MSKHTIRYEVCRDGTIISFTRWRGSDKRALTHELNDDGYPCVRVYINGKRCRRTVHSLVANAFLGPKPAPGYEVRHLDGNKLNPHADNLAWGTRKDNADDRERHGRTSRGAAHSASIRNSNQAEGTRAFRRAQKEARHEV